MATSSDRKALKYLSVLALLCGTGANPAPTLARVPSRVLGEAVAELEATGMDVDERRRVVGLLARDARAEVRSWAVDHALALWRDAPAEAERLLEALACDGSEIVRRAAAAGLERCLQHIGPLDRIPLVARWAVSEQAPVRAALATALAGPTPVFITDLALEELASDPSADVRARVVEAVALHRDEEPRVYDGVLGRLALDPVAEIRIAARRALHG